MNRDVRETLYRGFFMWKSITEDCLTIFIFNLSLLPIKEIMIILRPLLVIELHSVVIFKRESGEKPEQTRYCNPVNVFNTLMYF